MKIYLHNSSAVCKAAAGESILLACARYGIILSAACGGRQRCGKCRVQLVEGQIAGDEPDKEGWVRACMAVPISDITITYPVNAEIIGNETSAPEINGNARYAESRTRQVRKHLARAGIKRTGVALDIGTTTVSARLIDLDSSLVLDTISELNDQRLFGADVMSRIGAAKNGKTEHLFYLINRQTERIIASFQKKWNIPKIRKLSCSGNTVMLHLFLNIDPSGMGALPFTPVFLEEKELAGEALSLSVEKVTVLPSIAAFIGADVTAGLGVLDILNNGGPSLFIDIGTNGEMALYNNGSIFCCSTAAGPAFEGAEISCGLGGVKGAISAVELINGSISITSIGNVPPVGICGSGLIDAVAVMLKQGIVDESGSMTQSKNGSEGFHLAPGVSISARDIRQFQLAKSAIFSGIKILCKNAQLNMGEIKNVYIAGGFGFFINKQNAVASGVLPKEFLDIISICGNLSLQGAGENLLMKSSRHNSSGNFMERCKQIISKCSVIDLAADPSFMDEFAENMLFGEDS